MQQGRFADSLGLATGVQDVGLGLTGMSFGLYLTVRHARTEG
jgi:hypothetical protein